MSSWHVQPIANIVMGGSGLGFEVSCTFVAILELATSADQQIDQIDTHPA